MPALPSQRLSTVYGVLCALPWGRRIEYCNCTTSICLSRVCLRYFVNTEAHSSSYSIGPTTRVNPPSQTASQLVQPFFHGSPFTNAHTHTHTHTQTAVRPDICSSNSSHLCTLCSRCRQKLLIQCDSLRCVPL